MYVGDGEAMLRDTFHRARLAAPAILFLDEVDALVPGREAGSAGEGGPEAGLRLLSTLLTEMDGLEGGAGGGGEKLGLDTQGAGGKEGRKFGMTCAGWEGGLLDSWSALLVHVGRGRQ
jgi:SpoVK/Ycf46/Vps4 family AAA+-type ATPase